jgi:NAD(P)-dependent dehydrogenase (short-subunit alcohol dehydrogenase family)
MVAGETAYSATKFAVEGLSEALAPELEHLGVRITIVEPGPLRTDFAASAVAKPPGIGDYSESVGKALEWFQELAGNQPNDPRLVAEGVLEVVETEEPPLRLALGREAIEGIRTKLDRQRHDLDTWERLGTSTAA